MKTTLLLFSLLGISIAIAADHPATSTRGQVGISIQDSNQPSEMLPEVQAMIDAWAKGLPTNGLYCAVQISRKTGARTAEPRCIVNVVNNSSNFIPQILHLPLEAVTELTLFDSSGTAIEKTSAGKLFNPWAREKVEAWLRDQNRIRWRGRYFDVYPFSYSPVGEFSPIDLFHLSRPGTYTLRLHLHLAENPSDSVGNIHITYSTLPEVVAEIQILQQDIDQAAAIGNVSTNAPPK